MKPDKKELQRWFKNKKINDRDLIQDCLEEYVEKAFSGYIRVMEILSKQ